MSKAIRLFIICVMAAALLAAASVWAAAAAPEEDSPSAAPEQAEAEASAEEEQELPETVDFPAVEPAGTVYTVGSSGAALSGAYPAQAAVTVVDYAAEGADAGVQFAGESRYYYGAQITGVDCGVRIDGAVNGYFGSSAGAIPLYDPKGAVSGIVWGGGSDTAVNCGVGFLLNGDVTGAILVEDGASFACRDAVILCSAGSGSFRFHNARLSSEAGVLVQTESGAGDISVCYENGSYSGALFNAGSGTLSVAVGRGALLFGDTTPEGGPVEVTVATGGVWAVGQSAGVTRLTVEDGATVYADISENEDGSLTLTASDSVLEPGTYEAAPVADTLPAGHGPALPADDAPDADADDLTMDPAPALPAEEEAEAERDASRADDLFPLVPGQASADEADEADAPEAAEPAQTPQPEEEQPQQSASDKRMFPLVPSADEPAAAVQEPAEEPQPPQPEPAPEEDVPVTVPSEVEQSTMRHSLLLGMGLAAPSALSSHIDAPSPSLEFAARLAVRTTGQAPTVSLLKTGAKTHSFLPEALDNRAIILYNPYCCSAA